MKPQIIAAAAVVFIAVPVAQAQSVDDLLADHTLLRAELERCKQMGMPSTDDARCKTARAAEQKRFFGNGQSTYTQHPVDVFDGAQKFDPQPDSQKPQPPNVGDPHG
jgi:conjugative transfer region protein TrbK